MVGRSDSVQLISLNGKLYAFHGEARGEYDVLNDQWTTLADDMVHTMQISALMDMPSVWQSCFVHHNMIYMVCENADEFADSTPAQTCVYKFDVAKRKFSICQKISPLAIQCSLAAMVRAPRWQ